MPDIQESIIEPIELSPFFDNTSFVPLTHNELIVINSASSSEENHDDTKDITDIIVAIIHENDFPPTLDIRQIPILQGCTNQIMDNFLQDVVHRMVQMVVAPYVNARKAGKNERLAVISVVLSLGLERLSAMALGPLYPAVVASKIYDSVFTPRHNKYIDERLTLLNANIMLSLLNDKTPAHTLNLMYQYPGIACLAFNHEIHCLPGRLYDKSQQILLNQALEICEVIDPLAPLLHYDDVVEGEIDSYQRIAAELPRMIQTGRRLVSYAMRQANYNEVFDQEIEAYHNAAAGLLCVANSAYRSLSEAMHQARFDEVVDGELDSYQQIAGEIPVIIKTGCGWVSNAMRQANYWEMTDIDMEAIVYVNTPSLPEQKAVYYSPNSFLLSQSFFMDERQQRPITVSNQQFIDFWQKQLQVPSPLSLLNNKLSFQFTSSPKIVAQVNINYYPSNGVMTAQAAIGTALIGGLLEKVDGILEKWADKFYRLFNKKGQMLELVKKQHPKYNALYQKAMSEQSLLVDMMAKQGEPDTVIVKVTEYEQALQRTLEKLDEIIDKMQQGFNKKRYYQADKEPLESLHRDFKKQAVELKQAIDEADALSQDYPASYHRHQQLEKDRINAEHYLSALACFNHGSYSQSIQQLEDILQCSPEHVMAQELLRHIGWQQKNSLNLLLKLMQSLTAKTVEKLLLVAMHEKGIKINALLQFAISVSATPLMSQALIALSWSTLSSYLPLVSERFIQNTPSAAHYIETGIVTSILGTECVLTLLQGQPEKWTDRLEMVKSYLIIASQVLSLAGLSHRLMTQNIRENPFQSLITIGSGILGLANCIVTIDKLKRSQLIAKGQLVLVTGNNAILPDKDTLVLHHTNGHICAYWVDNQGMVKNKTITLASDDLQRLLAPQQQEPLIEHIASECGLVNPIVTSARQLVNSRAPAILSAVAIVPTVMAGLNWFRKDKKESSDIALLLGAVTTTGILAYNYRHSIADAFNSCRFFAPTNKNSSGSEISTNTDNQIPASPIPIV